jgi:hypothetical protein
MTFLASDVFDGARSPFLNDSAANLYTNTVLLPHLKAANEELEQLLIIYDVPVQRVFSAVIPVTAGETEMTIAGSPALPSDFLLPISLFERTTGDSDQSWTEMLPRDFEQINQVPTTTFNYYAFRNNGIYFVEATTNRDIKLTYDRQLALITGANSPVDFYLAKRFLIARVAELAARYTGQNPGYADELMIREVEPRKDDIERIFTLQGQNVRGRRPPYTTKPTQYYRR